MNYPESTILANKVQAVNDVNRILATYSPRIAAELKPYIGEKAVLAGGGYVRALKEKLDPIIAEIEEKELKGNFGARCFTRASGYHIRLEVTKTFDTSEHTVGYYTNSEYIADLEGLNVKEVFTSRVLGAPYTLEEVQAGLQLIEDLNKQLREAKSKINPFLGNIH